MILVGATEFGPAATVAGVVAGAVLDVVLGAILLPLAVDAHFAVTVDATDLGSVVNQAYLAGDPATLAFSSVTLDEDFRFALVHPTCSHVRLREYSALTT
ncbi:hypothetical protein [Sorangium sp. So ce1000]|uniref:hypothetical protein n=1 Tax=Sorangium sp. So ce1000 TaxID=3133325 RepID=UPI003F6377A5